MNKTTKDLQEFKRALEPYLFFWDKWVNSHDCNLKLTEVEIIDFFQKNSFATNIVATILHRDKIKQIPNITRKLTLGYGAFKSIVVANFLCGLVQYARTYPDGYRSFLQNSICDLKIPDELLKCLLSFKTYNIQLLVAFYKEEDFSQGLLYNKIVEYQISKMSLKEIKTLFIAV